jgi:hypothetical protein
MAIGGLCAAAATAATIAFTGSAAAAPGAPEAPGSSGMVPGTPCHIGSAACVQLGPQGFNGKAWFIRDHRVIRGPVPVATGGPGKDTSVGKFKVTIKDADHVSSETTNAEGNPSEMPYSVFFGNKGEAFHGGGKPTARTAGCVRLRNGDDSYFFNNLQKGDIVEIVSRSATSAPGGRDDSRDDSDRGRDNDDNGRDGTGLGGLLGGL